ncbi:hypothetical protein GCM10027184_44760 [Saccharothrix stipae]
MRRPDRGPGSDSDDDFSSLSRKAKEELRPQRHSAKLRWKHGHKIDDHPVQPGGGPDRSPGPSEVGQVTPSGGLRRFGDRRGDPKWTPPCGLATDTLTVTLWR